VCKCVHLVKLCDSKDAKRRFGHLLFSYSLSLSIAFPSSCNQHLNATPIIATFHHAARLLATGGPPRSEWDILSRFHNSPFAKTRSKATPLNTTIPATRHPTTRILARRVEEGKSFRGSDTENLDPVTLLFLVLFCTPRSSGAGKHLGKTKKTPASFQPRKPFPEETGTRGTPSVIDSVGVFTCPLRSVECVRDGCPHPSESVPVRRSSCLARRFCFFVLTLRSSRRRSAPPNYCGNVQKVC
jgi:hypothetical protein